ncbi:Na+/H+ antiporter NhaC family protein [Weeksella sp. HMSC059D05]|uniref:Na+/H+ antiporter NhaC family protein n=1 Tax=Weeksella sp. HMSC059D05 TaxID=1715139 RepID=UPI0008A4D7F4|nr:Na+/H+ antiporter NhaC family protein [Weeksella sp. HMSC059D05]OFM83192.1 sodium:proton antiporter [Weeksella sp. HMSC059D05]
MVSEKRNFWALLPLIIFIIVYFSISVYLNDFYSVPALVVFVAVTLLAFLQFPEISFDRKLKAFSQEAGNETLLLMILIFLLAGAFSQLGNAIGGIQSIANFLLHFLPAKFILPVFFLLACLTSISIGTSVGTIATLAPITVEIDQQIPGSLALLIGAIIGGAMFGDNLSFISDTTVAATRTQEIDMKTKFKANIQLVLPAAICTILFFWYASSDLPPVTENTTTLDFDFLQTLPYLIVFGLAIYGLNVLWALVIGVLAFLLIGVLVYDNTFLALIESINKGFNSMFELSLMCLIIGGLVGIIRLHGGIDYLTHLFTNRLKTKRQAELSIATMTALVDATLANNTLTILIVGNLAKEISEKNQLSPKRVASILDTMSCSIQGLLPYGAQILVALTATASLGKVLSPLSIIPYLIYPILIGISTIVSILFFRPKSELINQKIQ